MTFCEIVIIQDAVGPTLASWCHDGGLNSLISVKNEMRPRGRGAPAAQLWPRFRQGLPRAAPPSGQECPRSAAAFPRLAGRGRQRAGAAGRFPPRTAESAPAGGTGRRIVLCGESGRVRGRRPRGADRRGLRVPCSRRPAARPGRPCAMRTATPAVQGGRHDDAPCAPRGRRRLKSAPQLRAGPHGRLLHAVQRGCPARPGVPRRASPGGPPPQLADDGALPHAVAGPRDRLASARPHARLPRRPPEAASCGMQVRIQVSCTPRQGSRRAARPRRRCRPTRQR